MRLLHVVPSYLPARRYGGPIESVHGLCKALAARGHDVTVATTTVDGDGDSDVPLDRAVEMDGVRVRYFPSTFLRRLYYSPPMGRFFDEAVPLADVVHTHSVFLWPTTAAAASARRHARPLVLSPRGMLVDDLIRRRSTWPKRAWIALFERRNIERADAVHVTSEVEKHALLGLGLRPRDFIEVPNGVSLGTGDDACEVSDADARVYPRQYVLFLGRISWKKGLDRLVAALAYAPGVHLLVAGNDDEGYWPSVARLAAAAGVTGRVDRIGFTTGSAKRRLLQQARLVVLPSYSENFGNVVMEAMAAGVPVVVTPEVGLASLVQNSAAGLVVAGDPQTLGSAIASLAGDDAERMRLGENGRRVAATHSWDHVCEQMEQGYARVLRTP